MIKDHLGEDQLVLKNDSLYREEEMGDKYQDFNILKVIRPKIKEKKDEEDEDDEDEDEDEDDDDDDEKFVAKVSSKKNYQIYLMKKIDVNSKSEKMKQMKEDFEKLKELNHQNVIKYYQLLEDKDDIYIIKEFVDNGGLKNIYKAYKSMKLAIEEDTLWNIFMQCMSGLEYIHNKNIIHKKISLNNILMTENKVIKLDDIQFSFIQDEDESQKDKSTDIKEMGKVFKKLISTVKGHTYSMELTNIVESINKDYKKHSASSLYILIFHQYIKKVAKVTSINSIFRCMLSFPEFCKQMNSERDSYIDLQNQKKLDIKKDKPAFYLFMKFFDSFKENESDENLYCNDFRNLLYKNSQINNDVEISPTQVLEFLLEKLNKETGIPSEEKLNSFSTLSKKFCREKEKLFLEFQNFYLKNFNSFISNNFATYIKNKRLCNKCDKYFYDSFNVHLFIEFDAEMLERFNQSKIKVEDQEKQNAIILNGIKDWFKKQKKWKRDITEEHKLVCENCNTITDFREFKQFYYLPKFLIISLNITENYNKKLLFELPEELDLSSAGENGKTHQIFDLVGVVKRINDNKKNEYFISICKNQEGKWKVYDRNEASDIDKPSSHEEGIALILFYSAKI